MSWRSVPFVRRAALIAAACLLTAVPVQAGAHVKSGGQSNPQPQRAPVYVAYHASQSVALSVVVTTPAQPAREPVYVNLRGPDGQVRRFLVEGGREAIEFRQVVLRPGESLTVQLAAK
jgi:hypothetical protein